MISFKKKKMKLQESYGKASNCYIYGEKFEDEYINNKICHIIRHYWHYTG